MAMSDEFIAIVEREGLLQCRKASFDEPGHCPMCGSEDFETMQEVLVTSVTSESHCFTIMNVCNFCDEKFVANIFSDAVVLTWV